MLNGRYLLHQHHRRFQWLTPISDALRINLCMTWQILPLQMSGHRRHVDRVGEPVPDIIGYNEHRPTTILYARTRMKPKIRKPDAPPRFGIFVPVFTGYSPPDQLFYHGPLNTGHILGLNPSLSRYSLLFRLFLRPI